MSDVYDRVVDFSFSLTCKTGSSIITDRTQPPKLLKDRDVLEVERSRVGGCKGFKSEALVIHGEKRGWHLGVLTGKTERSSWVKEGSQ